MTRKPYFRITIGSALLALLISLVIFRAVLSRDEFIPFRYFDLLLVGVGGLVTGFFNYHYWDIASLVLLIQGIYLVQIFLDRLTTPNLFLLFLLFLLLLASILGGFVGSFLRRFFLTRTIKVDSGDEKEEAGDIKKEIDVRVKRFYFLVGFLGYFLLGILLARLFLTRELYMLGVFLMFSSFILVWILVGIFLIYRRWVAYGILAGWGINLFVVLLIEFVSGREILELPLISSALGSPILPSFILEIITN